MSATIPSLLFTRQLADLMRGGVPLHQSLSLIHKQTRNKHMQKWAENIKADVENGLNFSDAIKKQPGLLSSLHTSLIASGEALGTLDQSLDDLSSLLEKEMDVKKRIRTVLAYPLLLLLMSVSVSLFMVLFVIPRFEPLFQELGQTLPLPTQIILTSSAFLHEGGLYLLLAVLLTSTLLSSKKNVIGHALERAAHRVNSLHEFMTAWVLARWTPVLASLLKGGVPLSKALQLSREVVPFPIYKEALQEAEQKLHDGQSLSDALRGSLFPAMLCELIRVGEESGQLDDTLNRMGEQTQKKLDLQLKLLLSVLEPVLIVIMGALVSFVAFAMVLPIFEMSGTLQ